MYKLDQNATPFVDALKKFVSSDVTVFDVPGHHMGNLKTNFQDFIGYFAYRCDVNAPRGLDMLLHPEGVIKEAQTLAADAFNADNAFFLVNGTSGGILAMFLATLDANDMVILPRNCHKSVINALIISGAKSRFIMPNIDTDCDIANQPSAEDYEQAILKYPEAKAIFVINPTYFGSTIDLERITKFAHEHNKLVLVDEAHGCHFSFDKTGPKSAMDCGADVSAISVHKMGGSLTQSSLLVMKTSHLDKYDISKALQILTTTSPSNLLIASLDSARSFLALNGQKAILEAKALAENARQRINKIDGFFCHGKEHFQKFGSYDFDSTKLVIELDNIALKGNELYNILKDDYNIQMELAEQYVILALVTIGSKQEHIDNLVSALQDVSNRFYQSGMKYPKLVLPQQFPQAVLRTRVAYNSPFKLVSLDEAINQISRATIMVYPPGIPIITPGEMFTKTIVEKIKYYESTDCRIIKEFKGEKVAIVDLDNIEDDNYYAEDLESYYETVENTTE